MWSRQFSQPAMLLVLLSFVISLTRAAALEGPPYTPDIEKSNEFDWKLLKEFSGSEYGNVILSPFSLKLVMAMLYEGASGHTAKEIQTVFGFSDKVATRGYFNKTVEIMKQYADDDSLLVGMKIFLSQEIETHQKFTSTALASYNTLIEPTDFDNKEKTAHSINSWIEQLTKGHIQKLVKEDDLKDAIMLIASAIYYKGEWKNAFDKEKNYQGGFYLNPTATIPVPFMTTVNKFYYMESTELDAKILRMQYKGAQFSMYVVLPKSKAGLQKLISQTNLATIRRQLGYMQNTTVEVSFPKFKFQFGTKLSKTLQNLGIQQMFQNTASFPAINREQQKKRKLVVTDISQKAGIEVNEEGTEAFAATDITIGNKFGETDETFNVSRPFMFFILHEPSQSILFIGKVENPLANEQPLIPTVNVPETPPRVGGNVDDYEPDTPNNVPGKKSRARHFH